MSWEKNLLPRFEYPDPPTDAMVASGNAWDVPWRDKTRAQKYPCGFRSWWNFWVVFRIVYLNEPDKTDLHNETRVLGLQVCRCWLKLTWFVGRSKNPTIWPTAKYGVYQ